MWRYWLSIRIALICIDFFYRVGVLNLSNGIEEIGVPQWKIALCLLVAWGLTFAALSKGVKSTGKVDIVDILKTRVTCALIMLIDYHVLYGCLYIEKMYGHDGKLSLFVPVSWYSTILMPEIVFVLSVSQLSTFNIRYNCWTVGDRDFIYGMHTQLMVSFQMTPR